LLSGSVYETYLEDLDGAGTFVFTTLLLLVVLLSYFLIERMAFKYPEYVTYYNALLIALILVPLTWVNSNAMRVVQYYSIYLILFAPKIIGEIYGKNLFLKKVAYAICIVTLFTYNFKSTTKYKFYWEETGIYREP
jgi:transmembrane protein EpsG